MKIRKITAIVLVLAALCCTFTSCAPKLKMSGSSVRNTKTGTEYSFVTGPLLPKSVSDEVYISWKLSKKVKVDCHQIEGLDPEQWLYSSAGDLLCSTGFEAPDLRTFAPDKVYLCYNYEIVASFYVSEDKTLVDGLVDRYLGDVQKEHMNLNYNAYVALFESSENKSFYYKLRLLVDEENRVYLNDRVSGYFADVTDLLGDYVEGYYYDEGEYD